MPKREVHVFVPKRETRVQVDVEYEAQTHVSPKKHETRILQTRVLMPKREVRALVPKRETRIQPVLERNSRILTTQCEVRVLNQIVPKREAKTRIQPQMARIKADPKSPHPQGFEASPLDTPATNLRDYLIKKKSVLKITPIYCSELLITAILSECRCNSDKSKPLVFNQLSAALVSNSAKRRRFQNKKSFSDKEYPEVTSNMVGPCTTLSK